MIGAPIRSHVLELLRCLLIVSAHGTTRKHKFAHGRVFDWKGRKSCDAVSDAIRFQHSPGYSVAPAYGVRVELIFFIFLWVVLIAHVPSMICITNNDGIQLTIAEIIGIFECFQLLFMMCILI